MNLTGGHFFRSLGGSAEANSAELPYVMTCRIVGGPSNASPMGASIFFPSGNGAEKNDFDLGSSAPIPREWISNALNHSFVRRNGEISLITLLHCSVGSWSHALRFALHHRTEFADASFAFRASSRERGSEPAQNSPEPITRSGRPKIFDGFQLTLRGPIQVLDISRTGALERISFISRGGNLSGAVPPNLRAAIQGLGI